MPASFEYSIVGLAFIHSGTINWQYDSEKSVQNRARFFEYAYIRVYRFNISECQLFMTAPGVHCSADGASVSDAFANGYAGGEGEGR